MLSPRAIAVGGLGYAPAVYIRVGFWEVDSPAPDITPTEPHGYGTPRIGKYAAGTIANSDIRRGRNTEAMVRAAIVDYADLREMVTLFMLWRGR